MRGRVGSFWAYGAYGAYGARSWTKGPSNEQKSACAALRAHDSRSLITWQGDVEHKGRVGRAVLQCAGRGVDETCLPVRGDPAAFVDVAEDVELGLDPRLNMPQEVDATSAVPAGAQVAVPDRRAVRDQHVNVVGDSLPDRLHGARESARVRL